MSEAATVDRDKPNDDDLEPGEAVDLGPRAQEGMQLRDPSADPLPMELDAAADVDEDGYGEADGLEISAFQSEEMRQIFGATLPQYLQPVEEMLQQILSGAGGEGAIPALQGTVASLRSAARGMGFDQVVEKLDGLGAGLEALAGVAGEVPRAQRELLLLALMDLRDVAEEMGGEATGEPVTTLFSVLSGQPGVDPALLQRLSAAGLVTVDQLRQAELSEVAAVTGLGRAEVEELVRRTAPAPLPVDDRVAELPLDGQTLAQMLARRLEDQVEAEADVQELRAEVRRLQAQIQRGRADLERIGRRRDEASAELEEVSSRTLAGVAELSRFRAERAELGSRYQATQERLRLEERRIAELSDRRRELASRSGSLDRDLEQLTHEVRRVLRRLAVARSRTSDAGGRGP